MGAMPASEQPSAPADPLPAMLQQGGGQEESAEHEAALDHELQNATLHLEKIFANVNDHFAFLDRQWRYIYVNDAAVRLIGLPREKLIGQCIWDVLPGSVGTPFYEEAHRAFAEQCEVVFDHFYERSSHWFENHISAFPMGFRFIPSI